MDVLLVGGSETKSSGIINKLFALFETDKSVEGLSVYNGNIDSLHIETKGADLILWWPDIDNKEEKNYPVKDQGTVLICSKVIREETTRIDAVSRIFKMHGNAVVTITKKYKEEPCAYCTNVLYIEEKGSPCSKYPTEDECSIKNNWPRFNQAAYDDIQKAYFEFELIDALNNTWCKTDKLPKLVKNINALYAWTRASRRVSLNHNDLPPGVLEHLDYADIRAFIGINKELALKVAEGCGNRFFGNYSTRCTKLFPSTRKGKDYFLFSPRNVDKRYVSTEDLVLVDKQYYYGKRKPSVDTPVQLELYKYFPNINYMIHGHAYIKDAVTTLDYFPCGDLREVNSALAAIDANGSTKINLKNHGFLLMSKDVYGMQKHLNKCKFYMIGG